MAQWHKHKRRNTKHQILWKRANHICRQETTQPNFILFIFNNFFNLYVTDIIHQVLYDTDKPHTICNTRDGMWCHTTPTFLRNQLPLSWVRHSTLKSKEADSFESLVSIYHTTWCHNPQHVFLIFMAISTYSPFMTHMLNVTIGTAVSRLLTCC
jgi:hypothetical protein